MKAISTCMIHSFLLLCFCLFLFQLNVCLNLCGLFKASEIQLMVPLTQVTHVSALVYFLIELSACVS
jgi:hypothetical protein